MNESRLQDRSIPDNSSKKDDLSSEQVSSISLGNPIPDNSMYALMPESPRSSEVKLPIAEDIAKVRYRISYALVHLPEYEWDEAYQILLSRYPRTQIYKDIFDTCIAEAKAQKKQLNTFWQKYGLGDQGDRDTQLESSKIASSEASRGMFEEVFNMSPSNELQAQKGSITLRFIVDKKDFEILYEKLGDKGITPSALAFPELDGVGFSVLVFRSDLNGPGSMISNVLHENEHAQNKILRQRYNFLLSEENSIDSALAERLRRREVQPKSLMYKVKDELLAYFTTAEIVPPKRYSDKNLNRLIHLHLNDMIDFLSNESDTGQYYPDFKSKFPDIDRDQYVKIVSDGVNALSVLYDIYKSEYDKDPDHIPAARMTINVLEQFPLRSWPAVVRLLRKRHREMHMS